MGLAHGSLRFFRNIDRMVEIEYRLFLFRGHIRKD